MISVREQGSYNAIASYVAANMVDNLEGPTAEEIAAGLGISIKTVYRTLRMPGFFKTPRPVTQPRGYGFDPSKAINESVQSSGNAKPNAFRFGIVNEIETALGRVEFEPISVDLDFILKNVVQFCLATSQLNAKTSWLVTQTNAAKSRAVRFNGGDPNAHSAELDREWVDSLVNLINGCRKIDQLGTALLNSEAMKLADYWRLLLDQ